ncbi:thioesterase [Saccharomonospora sp. CUA-673]|uniref:thioesterase family protein n=1 Tax=Saccharomonospora sp. CUA-673 TaxID=1904969 RepID=UPI0009679770|nr:thioesterase family protein [Saccharomonospora sp. CUA-673]OLT45356.1 thioesterase [Saccharomonospora sp. CUA-673]
MTESYYQRIDEARYKPTPHTSGAWNPAEQHFSPLGGLITHAIDLDRKARGSDLVVSRLSFDILGTLALDTCDIQVDVIRPGRTIELVEAVAVIAGRPAVRARAWLLTLGDTTTVEGGELPPLTPPDHLDRWSGSDLWPGGYIASLDTRPCAPPQPGRTAAWISSKVNLVQGEDVGPVAAFVTHTDAANGIAVRRPPTEWMFPNVDLTIHLHRTPEIGWTGLDTTVTFGPDGRGITSSVLHDIRGQVGHAQQILTVRPL